jgi:hypothetical protein
MAVAKGVNYVGRRARGVRPSNWRR